MNGYSQKYSKQQSEFLEEQYNFYHIFFLDRDFSYASITRHSVQARNELFFVGYIKYIIIQRNFFSVAGVKLVNIKISQYLITLLSI